MSSIGINTNTFRITSKYLDLLHDSVVKVKINHKIDDARSELLIDFIQRLNDQNSTDPQFQLLSNIIERELRQNKRDINVYLHSIVEDIKTDNYISFLPKIEFLADVLDTENSEALMKIIGD